MDYLTILEKVRGEVDCINDLLCEIYCAEGARSAGWSGIHVCMMALDGMVKGLDATIEQAYKEDAKDE